MLHEFISENRETIITLTRERVAARLAPLPTEQEIEHGVPLFLSQLVETLEREQGTEARPTQVSIGQGALQHGADLARAGYTVGQVVHGYGDVCQAVTALAMEMGVQISSDEFKTLNRCLDEAIAQAVTEFAREKDLCVSDRGAERLGFFAHEVRNLLSNALLAFDVLKGGTVGIGGSTGTLLGRNLLGLRDLIDRLLSEVRLEAALRRREVVSLNTLLDEVELTAALEAGRRGLDLTLEQTAEPVFAEVDRQLVSAALANLLQNAFKFTRPDSRVALRMDADSRPGRVLIEVEDQCGGLPPGKADELFRPFEQRSLDRTGLGLGLAIAREGVEMSGGTLRVRNLPGRGCIFTIDLPRSAETVSGDGGTRTAVSEA